MKDWLATLGYKKTQELNVIHITGTKGKGGTAAFTESLLRAHYRHASRPIKTGLYTSPHMITERERIRIDFRPLSERAFARYFFEVWDTLRENVHDEKSMPGYLQLLALLSVHAFNQEAVDVSIYEVHAGGRKDATNMFDQPVACGFTTIGLDHTDILGTTIESIAWHKSGILKSKTPGYSVVQTPAARLMLEREAAELNCPLTWVDIREDLPQHRNVQLIAQKLNASLAIQLANAYLRQHDDELSSSDIGDGIASCNWPGRFHTIGQGNIRWCLDCAHNVLSLPVAMEWFEIEARSRTRSQHDPIRQHQKILIFGHESKRSTCDLIEVITQYCKSHRFTFDLVILTPYNRYGSKIHDDMARVNAGFWRKIHGSSSVLCSDSLEDALNTVRLQYLEKPTDVLITGSTHLVGQALALLPGGEENA